MKITRNFAGIALAIGLVLAPMTASAVTNHAVSGDLGLEFGLANGAIYGSGGTLTTGDSASVFVVTDDDETTSVIGFGVAPVPIGTSVDIALSGIDVALFGGATIKLATASNGTSVFESGIISASTFVISASVPVSPFYVLIDWTGLTTPGGGSNALADYDGKSWSYNVSIGPVAPVPLPAGLALLLCGLGGLAMVGRRRMITA